MSNVKTAQEITEKLAEAPFIFYRGLVAAGDPPARKYLLQGTKEWYYASSEQITVCPHGNDPCVLNVAGLSLIEEIQLKYESGQIKDHIGKYYFGVCNSGFWAPDNTSSYYSNMDCICLNTHNNVDIIGTRANGKLIHTSPAVVFTKDWVWTDSGSLYSLGELISYDDISQLHNDAL